MNMFKSFNQIVRWSPDEPAGGDAAPAAAAPPVAGAEPPAPESGAAAPGATILTEKPATPPAETAKPAEFVADPAKTAEENAAAKAEHDAKAAKPEDKPAVNELLGAPETYDLKTPEGYEIDADVRTEFETTAKEIGLSQKGAEKLVAIQTKLQEKQAERTANTIASWAKDVKADKELGGNDYDAKMAVARESLATFGDEDLGVLLDKTGIGNHPAMIRFMYRAGKAMGEGTASRGGAPGGKVDAASVLYPNEAN